MSAFGFVLGFKRQHLGGPKENSLNFSEHLLFMIELSFALHSQPKDVYPTANCMTFINVENVSKINFQRTEKKLSRKIESSRIYNFSK
jgi:hypothetical protein